MNTNYGFIGFINPPLFEPFPINETLYSTPSDCKGALMDFIASVNSDLGEDIPYDYSMCEIKFAKEENGCVTILS